MPTTEELMQKRFVMLIPVHQPYTYTVAALKRYHGVQGDNSPRRRCEATALDRKLFTHGVTSFSKPI